MVTRVGFWDGEIYYGYAEKMRQAASQEAYEGILRGV